MKAKIEIVEDTITTYMNNLTKQWDEKESKLQETLGYDFIREVKPRVDTGELISSGSEESNWEFIHSDGISELYITYTGKDNPQRWWEFGGFEPFSEWRDYAWFQETGQDEVADSRNARKKWFIREAAYKSKAKILEDTQKHFLKVLRG